MTILSAPDLAAMRSVAADSLGGTAVIQTQTFVSDGGGGGSTTWAPSGTVECRVAPFLRGGEGVEGDRLSPESQVIFTFPAETDIDHNTQILHAGGTFTVTATRQRTDEVTRRVEAREVE